MKDEDYSKEEILITRYLAEEATPEEKQRLQEWLALSGANQTLFEKIKKTYELTANHQVGEPKVAIDVNQEWARFEASVAQRDKNFGVRFSVWKMAAAILLVIASGFVANYILQQNREIVFSTSTASQEIFLPDGTKVTMNANTSLSYEPSFGDEAREVKLEGEAFFEVVPDNEKKFVVKVNKAAVSVLGTSFNVDGNSKDQLQVVVETGIVALTSDLSQDAVELRPGDKGIFELSENRIKKMTNDDVNFLSWKTRRIVFQGNDLASVADVLRHVYGVEVVISTAVSPECEVTVAFDNQSLEAVLAVLESTLDLTYKRTGNKIEIIKAGC